MLPIFLSLNSKKGTFTYQPAEKKKNVDLANKDFEKLHELDSEISTAIPKIAWCEQDDVGEQRTDMIMRVTGANRCCQWSELNMPFVVYNSVAYM